jgi:CRP-like cAMP-binding protein
VRDLNNPKNIAYIKFLGSGVGFGEIALLYNEKRTATIKTVDPCDLWILEGKVFKNIIIKSVLQRRMVEISFLEKVELFKDVDKYEKIKLVDGL